MKLQLLDIQIPRIIKVVPTNNPITQTAFSPNSILLRLAIILILSINPLQIPSETPMIRAIPASALERTINAKTAVTSRTSPTVERISAVDCLLHSELAPASMVRRQSDRVQESGRVSVSQIG